MCGPCRGRWHPGLVHVFLLLGISWQVQSNMDQWTGSAVCEQRKCEWGVDEWVKDCEPVNLLLVSVTFSHDLSQPRSLFFFRPSVFLTLCRIRTPPPTPPRWGRTTPARRAAKPSETSTTSTATGSRTPTRNHTPAPSASSALRGKIAWATTCARTKAAWRNRTCVRTVPRRSPGEAPTRRSSGTLSKIGEKGLNKTSSVFCVLRPDHLNSHVRQVHSTERPFKCTVTPPSVCQQYFTWLCKC